MPTSTDTSRRSHLGKSRGSLPSGHYHVKILSDCDFEGDGKTAELASASYIMGKIVELALAGYRTGKTVELASVEYRMGKTVKINMISRIQSG